MFLKGRSRKPSYASMTNEIIIEEDLPQRVRTRSRSQGNMQFSFMEKPNYTMGEERVGEEKVEYEEMVEPTMNVNGNISEHLEIAALKSGYELMEEEPVSMKKKKGSFLLEEGESQENKMDCEFRFCNNVIT